MKKVSSLMLAICMLFALAACGNNTMEQGAVNDPSASRQSNSDADSRESKETDAGQEAQKIDVDLTQLSSTMVYSEVYNMMYSPEDYVGKTVKMNGAFALYCQQMTENGEPDFNFPVYYACVIADATACCSQGLEFVLAGDYVYPNDYPELGGNITVVGTFETYEEDGNMYCHLVDAEMSE